MYCNKGDNPTVKYVVNEKENKISFSFSPIDVQVLPPEPEKPEIDNCDYSQCGWVRFVIARGYRRGTDSRVQQIGVSQVVDSYLSFVDIEETRNYKDRLDLIFKNTSSDANFFRWINGSIIALTTGTSMRHAEDKTLAWLRDFRTKYPELSITYWIVNIPRGEGTATTIQEAIKFVGFASGGFTTLLWETEKNNAECKLNHCTQPPRQNSDKYVIEIKDEQNKLLFSDISDTPIAFTVQCGRCGDDEIECKCDRYPFYCCIPCKPLIDKVNSISGRLQR